MNFIDKDKNLDKKDKFNFLLLLIVGFNIVIWILVLNDLFNPLLAMMLMFLMIVIIRIDKSNKEKEEREKMK